MLVELNAAFPCSARLGGCRIAACDGTEAGARRNPADASTWCTPRRGRGKEDDVVCMVPLLDVLERRSIDAAVMPAHGKSGFGALCELSDAHREGAPETIAIADRGFASCDVSAHPAEGGLKFLVRAKDQLADRLPGSGRPEGGAYGARATRLLTGSGAARKRDPGRKGDCRIVQGKVRFDYLGGFDGVCAVSPRIARPEVGDGLWEAVATNLPEAEFGTEGLKRLHSMRRGIETSFRNVKQTLGAASFRSGKFELVSQELRRGMVPCNFCSIIASGVEAGRGEREHGHRIDFTAAPRICHAFAKKPEGGPPPDVEAAIASRIQPVRPGRRFRRQMTARRTPSCCYKAP